MSEVIFYEAFDEEVSAIKKYLPEDINARYTWKTIQEQKDVSPPAQLISIRTQSRIPDDWGKQVRGILTRSQGYDHLTFFRREIGVDIPCGYLDDYCARAAAEQAVMMMMVLLRKLKKQISNFQTFNRNGLTGAECQGRKVFVAGVGHIGSAIVDIIKGLRMQVKGFDIEQKVEDLAYVPMNEGIFWADILFCALPLTDKTIGLIGCDAFKRAQPGKIFVNVSRGEISPIEDLKKLLDNGTLDGIGLDVYPGESALANQLRDGGKSGNKYAQIILDLSKRDNVLFTPHNAFNTGEAVEQKSSLSAAAVIHFFKHGTFPNPIPSL